MESRDVHFHLINYDPEKIKEEMKQKESVTRIHVIMNALLMLTGLFALIAGLTGGRFPVFLIGVASVIGSFVYVCKKIDAFGAFLNSLKCQYHLASEQRNLVSLEVDTLTNRLILEVNVANQRTVLTYTVEVVLKEGIADPELDIENTILYIPRSMLPKTAEPKN